jgi:lipopolysaccharide export system protein LptC
MSLRRITLVLVVTTVAALGFWLGRDAEERLELLLGPTPDTPELYLERFTSLSTGADGMPRYRISGERMEQFQLDGSSRVEAPVMILHRDDGPDWTVVSERGWISPDGDEVQLLGEVHLTRPEDAHSLPVDIHTRDVTVWPTPRQAETAAYVTVRSPLYEVDGTGMRADLETSVLELLHDADGTYFPERHVD